MRKWDSWEMAIKWDSEVYKDEKSGLKSCFTYLLCDKAVETNSPYGRKTRFLAKNLIIMSADR